MIRKSVVLPLAPVAAFELFTRRIDEWWPADRRHAQDASSKIFMLRTGRFYERTPEGHEVELGCVRSWDSRAKSCLISLWRPAPKTQLRSRSRSAR